MVILWVWIQFLILAIIIGFAGYRLCYYAEEISEKTGLGRNWIGLILLATITSLPELMTSFSAIRLIDNPDLAVGDIFGSCVFNLALVVALDLIYREGSVYSKATQGHVLTGALGIILISFVGFSFTVSRKFLGFSIAHVGGYAAMIPVFYLIAMRGLYIFEKKNAPQKAVNIRPSIKEDSLKNAYTFFGLSALVVVVSGMTLPFVAEQIIEHMGWNSAFVGTIFIAFATSLPEIAVTFGAIKLRAVELAFSNVLGSNLFNIVILTIDDFLYTKGPLFQSISATHVVTIFSAIMMTGLVLIALIQPPQKRILNTISIFSVLLLGIYIFNAYIVFKVGL